MPGPDDAADLPPAPAGMPLEVADQIVKDLERGPKVLNCLSTAAHLIAEAREDQTGLRLVESAAYNLREALDAVVAGRDAGASGMPAVKDALDRFRLASSEPDADEVAALRRLANDLGRLDALFDHGLVHPPRDGEPWPIAALVSGTGGIAPTSTVSLLERLRAAASTGDPDEFLALDRNLIQLCLRLGPDAHVLVATIVRKRPMDHWIQRIAVYIAKDADPSAPIQVTVADAVIATDTTSDASYQTRTMAGLLVDGLDAENARDALVCSRSSSPS